LSSRRFLRFITRHFIHAENKEWQSVETETFRRIFLFDFRMGFDIRAPDFDIPGKGAVVPRAPKWRFPKSLVVGPTYLPKRPTCANSLVPTIFILRLGGPVQSTRFFGRAAKRELYFKGQPLSPRSEKAVNPPVIPNAGSIRE
jgi:hypothetical protein